MFYASSTPTAFFLLFAVLGGRIYFVSWCPFARKEKQVWPVENLIVLIPPFHVTQEMKEKVRGAGLLRGITLCPAARYLHASRGKLPSLRMKVGHPVVDGE